MALFVAHVIQLIPNMRTTVRPPQQKIDYWATTSSCSKISETEITVWNGPTGNGKKGNGKTTEHRLFIYASVRKVSRSLIGDLKYQEVSWETWSITKYPEIPKYHEVSQSVIKYLGLIWYRKVLQVSRKIKVSWDFPIHVLSDFMGKQKYGHLANLSGLNGNEAAWASKIYRGHRTNYPWVYSLWPWKSGYSLDFNFFHYLSQLIF